MSFQHTITGKMTFDEYLECNKVLSSKRRLWVRSIFILYGIGSIIFGLSMISSKPNITVIIIGVLFVLYGLFISPIQFRFRVKHNWDRYPKIKQEFNITILEDGLQTIDDKGNPSHTAWDTFIRFQESKSLFLLYISPVLPLCIPKRLIALHEQDGLRSLISASVGRQSDARQATSPEAMAIGRD